MAENKLERALEDLIDQYTLEAVLDRLSDVCMAKAEHVLENWQDKPLSTAWIGAGLKISDAQAYAFQRSL